MIAVYLLVQQPFDSWSVAERGPTISCKYHHSPNFQIRNETYILICDFTLEYVFMPLSIILFTFDSYSEGKYYHRFNNCFVLCVLLLFFN